MLIESLIKATMELQGFRVASVTGHTAGLVAELVPDGRFTPRCGRCHERAPYRDTRHVRCFRHVLTWGTPVTRVSTRAVLQGTLEITQDET